VVVGHLPVAIALARLGGGLGYEVSVMGPGIAPGAFSGVEQAHAFDSLDFSQLRITPQTYVVVASHGNYDEEGLTGALMSDAPYVALVASRKRAESVVHYLREAGLPADRLARLKYPAGLDIGAVTPEEIALSILAEILQVRRHRQEQAKGDAPSLQPGPIMEQVEQAEQLEAIDLVCGMTVEIATARHKSEYNGQIYYFCAPGCKRSFEKDPHKYLVTGD
jgi:xanthine dehydrogenase accessory factor